MRRRGFQLCPLCRAQWQVVPEPEVQQAQENETGYVVLGHSPEWGDMLGRHPVRWFELEVRLGFRPGTLAGRLHEHNLVLRHYCGVGMAQMWWTELGLSGTPPSKSGRRCPRYYVDGHSRTDAESPVLRRPASRWCVDAQRVAGASTPGAPWQPHP